jgi:hypothetical protein
LQLQATQARIINHLRTAGGIAEPEILTKKAKNVFTHVAMYLISDGTNFDTISNDNTRWSDDKRMRATVQAGLGLFIYTGADGTIRHEVRVVDRDDLALRSREYKNLTSSSDPVLLALPSGRLRLGPHRSVVPVRAQFRISRLRSTYTRGAWPTEPARFSCSLRRRRREPRRSDWSFKGTATPARARVSSRGTA